MDVMEKLLTDLKTRLGYSEEMVISRDEFNTLVDGDVGTQKELEEEIEELKSEVGGLTDQLDDLEELQEKLNRIAKIIEE